MTHSGLVRATQGSNALDSDADGFSDVMDSNCCYTDVCAGSLHERLTLTDLRYVHLWSYYVPSVTDCDDSIYCNVNSLEQEES